MKESCKIKRVIRKRKAVKKGTAAVFTNAILPDAKSKVKNFFDNFAIFDKIVVTKRRLEAKT